MSTRPICMLTDWLMCMSMFWLCINLKGLVLVDGADIGAAGISEQLEAKDLVEQVVGNTTKLPQWKSYLQFGWEDSCSKG